MAGNSNTGNALFLVDPEAVFALAECGLTLAEIFARLEVPAALPLARREAVEDAYRKGRAAGIARIKQLQYQAALEGKPAAQAQVLKNLGAGSGEDDTAPREIPVVREIIHPEGKGAETGEG